VSAPIVGGILDVLAGIVQIVGDRLDKRRAQWAEDVATQPMLAALRLENAAEDLEASVEAMRPKRRARWVGRRRLAKAQAMRDQAENIRRFARNETCESPMRRPL
jgi:hypothetical protein